MSAGKRIGLDVGGAHLKLVRLSAGGRIEAVRIASCPLWLGLDRLDDALDAVANDLPADVVCSITMTGELVDLWPDRASGVAAIAESLAARLGTDRTAFYAGEQGFVRASDAAHAWRSIASANWRATAEALARDGAAGVLVDIGSTTTDLIPFADCRVSGRGATDAERMAAEELLYLGVVRTPVMALASRMPYAGSWVAPMAEHFATAADVFRLTGDLDEGDDLHPPADGGEKTVEASARRLLRMVGADLDASTEAAAPPLASWLAEAALRRIADAVAAMLSRPDAPKTPVVHGAGVGRFLARRVAHRLGLLYRDVGEGWCDEPALSKLAGDCAPAAAVAILSASQAQG